MISSMISSYTAFVLTQPSNDIIKDYSMSAYDLPNMYIKTPNFEV